MLSNYKKSNNNIYGFTLIELMIVIATIALLMIVLVPRFGTVSNKAKEIGLRSNMLMLEGIIQSTINDYDATDVSTFEDAINAQINAVSDDNQKIRNPITGSLGCGEGTLASTAVTYSSADDADNGTGIDGVWTSPLANAAGNIAFCAYTDKSVTPNRLAVKLIPYGADNKRITSLEKVIVQY